MTPALKAMVEAMIAEVSRQVYTDYTTEDPSPEPFVNDLLVDGRLDMEKVARAGLESGVLAEAFAAGFDAGIDFADCREGKYRPVDDPPGPDEAAKTYVDAILKDQP